LVDFMLSPPASLETQRTQSKFTFSFAALSAANEKITPLRSLRLCGETTLAQQYAEQITNNAQLSFNSIKALCL